MDMKLEFTDRQITPWGGMGLMKRMLDHIGFERALGECDLPAPGSNRAYRPEQLMIQFMLSVWCGANRFSHLEVTRFDQTLGSLFGIKRMAGFRAVMRLLGRFDQGRNEQVFGQLYRWLFERLNMDRVTVDLDSSVITRYGQAQEGSRRGYNPKKPGRPSHHPLMAFVADTKMVANSWLRPGNTHSANNACAFLASTQAHLGAKRIGLLRADSGFSDQAFIHKLETERIAYVIALRLNQPLQRALVDARAWWCLDEGIELADFEYQAPSWDKPRRVIGIRQHVGKRAHAKGKTLSLFADAPDVRAYRYAALVTDLTLPAQQVWRMYRGRADCENRIKELKYDFGLDSFNAQSFWATEAALHMAMMAYNLMSLFRQAVLKQLSATGKDVQRTLATLRHQLFAQAGYITQKNKSPTLKLATAKLRREWFSGLWNQAKTFDLPVKYPPIYPSG